MGRISIRVACLVLGLLSCAPAPRTSTPARPSAAPAVSSGASALAPISTPMLAESPVVIGEPVLVAQRGLHSFASGIRISARGTLVAVADQGPEIRLAGGNGAHRQAAFSPDGKILAWSRGDRKLVLSDASNGMELRQMEISTFRTLSISPDGAVLAAARYTGAVRLWELASFKPLGQLPDLDSEETGALSFHPKHRALAVARGSLHLFCMVNSRSVLLQAVSSGSGQAGVAFSEEGFFSGDTVALAALRFRKGTDLRAPMVVASEVATQRGKPRLPGDLVDGCK